MSPRKVRVKAGENLSPENIQKVTEALESSSPITKKEACAMLNITYNTTRLGKIIEEHKDHLSFVAKRKKQMRNKPVDIQDKREIVQDYLSGISIAEISESVYRSPNVVRNILRNFNIPIRNKAYNYFSPVFLDEDTSPEDYTKGDLVFAARYNSPAYIEKEVQKNTKEHGKVYRIWILGDHCQWAVQPYYELSDLRRLQSDLNIKVHEMDKTEIMQLIYEGLRKAKKLKKE